jgi:hypothetical protein
MHVADQRRNTEQILWEPKLNSSRASSTVKALLVSTSGIYV